VEYSKNKFYFEVMDQGTHDDMYKVVDDIIYYEERIYLVPESTIKDKIMEAMHNTPLARHIGLFKTYTQVRERFNWKGLKDDVLNHVRVCVNFQQNKSEHTHPTRLLQLFPIPEHKWESISMDFITGISKAQGKYCIMYICSG
jgi:hypothetical protein